MECILRRSEPTYFGPVLRSYGVWRRAAPLHSRILLYNLQLLEQKFQVFLRCKNKWGGKIGKNSSGQMAWRSIVSSAN